MKNKKMNKRFLAVLLTLVTLLSLMPAVAGAISRKTENGYYYNQLTTQEARNIYSVLENLCEDGKLKSGTYTIDLVEEGVLKNTNYDKDVLMADFSSARDAFVLDNADIIYLDADKFTVTQTQKDGNYVITLGVGREDTYFADGFNSENTDSAIKAFKSKVEAIALLAEKKSFLDEKIKVAFDEVVKATEYALEKDAKPENVNYVRNPYGALVKGQAVCEGYARALKSVLDLLNIENVLVEGTFVDGTSSGPHMWNYVKMDDNLWYLLDATAQDGLGKNADGDEYFLKTANSDVFKYYQPDGVISLSKNAFEFSYPNVAVNAYERLSTAFVAEKIEIYNNHISYFGKGLFGAQEGGKYVIASHNNINWFYYERYAELSYLSMGHEYNGFTDDYGTYFIDRFEMAYFAVTDIAPDMTVENPADKAYYTFYGDYKYDVSKVEDVINYKKVAPVAVKSEPSSSRLDGGEVYSAKVVYSEDLKLANSAAPATLDWVIPVEGAEIIEGSFNWNEEEASVITFQFKTAVNYNFTTSYCFTTGNLVGVESLLAPKAVGFTVVNNPVFGCPKIENSVNVAYANTPALIDDKNLAENDWKDADGNSLNLPYRLSLVASEIPAATADKMIDAVEKESGEEVLASKTYEISLGLCNNQIAYVTGKKVKVFVPFPDGYNAQSGVTFKAYHFDKDGYAEEIDCVTTETGIIMMCDKFSPFAVVATKSAASEKTVMTVAGGNGDFDKEIIKLSKGEAENVTIKADEGYKIENLTLNGIKLSVTNEKEMVVTLAEESLKAGGNILEASFVLKEINIGDVSTPEIPDEPFEPNEPGDNEPSEGKSFFDRIVSFFKMIFDFFKNLFS